MFCKSIYVEGMCTKKLCCLYRKKYVPYQFRTSKPAVLESPFFLRSPAQQLTFRSWRSSEREEETLIIRFEPSQHKTNSQISCADREKKRKEKDPLLSPSELGISLICISSSSSDSPRKERDGIKKENSGNILKGRRLKAGEIKSRLRYRDSRERERGGFYSIVPSR